MALLHKYSIAVCLLTLFGCRPMNDEAYSGGGSSLMGVSPTGRTAITGSIREALSGYTGTISGGAAYVGGGYGGNGLAGQMHCKIGSGSGAWLSGCSNVTTQGFLPPGSTFSSSGGQSLWSWEESTDRILRIIGGSDSLRQNSSLSSSSANESIETENGEPFENLMASNPNYFKSLNESDASTQGFQGEGIPMDSQYAYGDDFSGSSGAVSGFGLTASTSDRPVYEEYAASKLASLRCQVGSKSSAFTDVIEVVLRKGSAVLNAYFAKGIGYVGYKYVRSGNGGGTGTNILVCIDPSNR